MGPKNQTATGSRGRGVRHRATIKPVALALLATLLLGVPSLHGVAAAADAPACQSASSDSDGDGWGWENDASCKVVPSAPAAGNNAASDDDHGPDGGDAGDSGCDYSQAHHNGGWGWNDSTRTSCPPRTVVSEPEASELDGFVMIDLEVGERSGNAHLTWTAPFPNAVYSVYSFVADSDGEVITERATTQRTWATRTGTAANRFFMVIVEDGDNASAGSGLFNTGGECVDFCDQRAWRSPLDADADIRRVAAVPAIIVVHIVREVARRAGQWCASNPKDCSDALIYVSGQVYDTIGDDPAGLVAAEQEEDLIEQGFVVVDRDDESGIVVLERDDTTVEIETIDIAGPENGVVQTTWTDRDAEGRTRTVRVDRQFVTEQPAGNTPVRGDVVSAETTYYYSITGELVGSATQYYRNGVITGTSCSGQVGLTTCSESDDGEPMTTGELAAIDYGGDVQGGEFGGTPTVLPDEDGSSGADETLTTGEQAAEPYGGDVEGGEFGGTPTASPTGGSNSSGADEQQNIGGSGGFDETESSQTTGEQAAEDYGGNVQGGEFG